MARSLGGLPKWMLLSVGKPPKFLAISCCGYALHFCSFASLNPQKFDFGRHSCLPALRMTCRRNVGFQKLERPAHRANLRSGRYCFTVLAFNKLEFVNLILFGSKQIPHPFLLHNSPALYKKHSFLHSK